jgi:uncharacterized repeat protein (TIGR03803 family)
MTTSLERRGWISRILRVAGATLALAVLATQSAQAQTFTILHTFRGAPGDGAAPAGSLVMDDAGNFYGTTASGGSQYLMGSVYRLSSTGREIVLHAFISSSGDGSFPLGGVIRDAAGNLYGTTNGGGTSNLGTVFQLDRAGNETVLHSFAGGPTDGAHPYFGSLVRDEAGNLYGTTLVGGGGAGDGTVFRLDAAGNMTLLHKFTGGTDGSAPIAASLVRDAAGNLYGTTRRGGDPSCAHGCGTVFRVSPDGTETVLNRFAGGTDGANPESGLIQDAAGNLYGTTYRGGAFRRGTVFKLDANGVETVLHSFAGNRRDGVCPRGASLVQDPAGSLYGTTHYGGTGNCDDGFGFGCGTVFKVDTNGIETVLHSFTGKDGQWPYGGLIIDAAGNLYGTAFQGGRLNNGVVFKLTP